MIRSLGLALLFQSVIAGKPLVEAAARDMVRGVGPWIAVIAMFSVGYVLAFGARRWAAPAAIAYFLAQIAAWRWTAIRGAGFDAPQASLMAAFNEPLPRSLFQLVLQLLWPAVVLAAVWLARRSYARSASRRAEAGGVFAVLGLAPLLWLTLHAVALGVSVAGEQAGSELAIWLVLLGIELCIAWLALRAAHRLISGAARPPLTALLLVMGAEVVTVIVAFLFAPFFGDFSFKQLALLAAAAALPLVTPLCLRAYARRAGPLEHPAAPDSAAAAGAVAWLVLWNAIAIAIACMNDHGVTGLAVGAVRAAVYLAVFVVWLRGSPRAVMWTAAIVGFAELALFVAGAIFTENFAMTIFFSSTRVMVRCAPLLVLAWLHRPSARREVGVEAVFE